MFAMKQKVVSESMVWSMKVVLISFTISLYKVLPHMRANRGQQSGSRNEDREDRPPT